MCKWQLILNLLVVLLKAVLVQRSKLDLGMIAMRNLAIHIILITGLPRRPNSVLKRLKLIVFQKAFHFLYLKLANPVFLFSFLKLLIKFLKFDLTFSDFSLPLPHFLSMLALFILYQALKLLLLFLQALYFLLILLLLMGIGELVVNNTFLSFELVDY